MNHTPFLSLCTAQTGGPHLTQSHQLHGCERQVFLYGGLTDCEYTGRMFICLLESLYLLPVAEDV